MMFPFREFLTHGMSVVLVGDLVVEGTPAAPVSFGVAGEESGATRYVELYNSEISVKEPKKLWVPAATMAPIPLSRFEEAMKAGWEVDEATARGWVGEWMVFQRALKAQGGQLA